jgi:hypothetical protein
MMINQWSEASTWWSTTSHFNPESGLVANVQHPQHSPDLAPSDLCLFGPFNNFYQKKDEDQNALQKKNSCAIFHIPWKETLPWRNIASFVKQWINVWMLMVITWKNKQTLVCSISWLYHIFSCNKYVDAIWCCTFKFRPLLQNEQNIQHALQCGGFSMELSMQMLFEVFPHWNFGKNSYWTWTTVALR